MKLEIRRYGLEIVPENVMDVVYVEEVLGLKEDGDSVPLKRENAMGIDAVACLIASKEG